MRELQFVSVQCRTLARVLEPLQCLEDFFLARDGGFALFLFFLDDLFRRVGDEFLVRQFGVRPA